MGKYKIIFLVTAILLLAFIASNAVSAANNQTMI